MADIKKLEDDAVSFAQKATTFDQQGQAEMAVFFYYEAAQALCSALQAGSQWPNILEKANEYRQRAELIKQQRSNSTDVSSTDVKSSQQLGVERARFLIESAFEEDELGNGDEAFKMYREAAELCLKLREETKDDLQNKIVKLAELALERAEALKLNLSKPTDATTSRPTTRDDAPPNSAVTQPPNRKGLMTMGPLGLALRDDDGGGASGGGTGGGPRRPVGGGGYSADELQVLRTTSTINGQSYVPFLETREAKERFAFPVPFTDKSGMLALSPKQREKFGKWMRPQDLCDNPQMIYAVSSFSIRQTIVSDCSFVASLAIAAQYERRFNKKLITSIIYPQNRSGDPEYNPCGKYMIRLNLNGVQRKVIIDDYLPVSRDGSLLCSYSNNRNELWVSMLEKAYMKVMGGYDFPGSNSNIDLHALTGWIPERVQMGKSRNGSSDEFNPEREFQRIKERFHLGHCLVTVATGELASGEADRAGLVPTHAYAMLDIQVVQGFRLFQLKNPWSHLRWRGNFSELDTVHWTDSMKKTLNYDPQTASVVDNGVFWIDYDSLMRFFDVFYINWNPDIFPFTTCYHQTWAEGPKKDSYSIGLNPQYRLEVSTSKPSAVWILLTRHITDKDDFADNKEFITLLVYKTDGRRVYYPYDPPPFIDGIRINSPHYLCKMVLQPGTSLFTLVVSQYERNNTIHYTLRVYATTEFKLTKVNSPHNNKYDKQVTGEWKGRSAGGCGNYPETTVNNPTYQLRVDSKTTENQILIELRGPKTFSVGIDVFTVSETVPGGPGSFTKKSSGDFRRGYVYLELVNVSGGLYNIRPCTFYPNQEAPFFLNVSSSAPIALQQIS